MWGVHVPKFDSYYIVEYRFPIKVDDTSSVIEAVSIANRICERVHGFKPDNWNARIFEYSVGEKKPGTVKEYFYNPHSVTVREITKNLEYHGDMIKNGETPADIMQIAKQMEEDHE